MATQTLFTKNATQNSKLAKQGVKSKMFSTYRSLTKKLDNNGLPLDGTCAADCPMLTKCYANFSFTNIAATRANDRNDNLIECISKLPKNSYVRHLVSGDFGMGDTLDDYLPEAIEAHKARPDCRGYSYTHLWRHYDSSTFNQVDNFVVNASCETDDDVRKAIAKGYPTVQVVPMDTPHKLTKEGFKAIVCPAQTEAKLSCEECMLCAKPNRKVVIMFLAHASNKKKIGKMVMDLNANLQLI